MRDIEQQEQIKDLEQLLLTYGEARTTTNDALVLLTYLRQQLETQEIIVQKSLSRQRKLELIINDLRQQMQNPDNLDAEVKAHFTENSSAEIADDQ